jgi:hypothetical protein
MRLATHYLPTTPLQSRRKPYTCHVMHYFTFLTIYGPEKGCLLPWLSPIKLSIPAGSLKDLSTSDRSQSLQLSCIFLLVGPTVPSGPSPP